jgi:hypothetical protein
MSAARRRRRARLGLAALAAVASGGLVLAVVLGLTG